MGIAWRDTPDAFGAVSVILHWIVAILVSFLLVTALMMFIWLPDRTAPPLPTPFGLLDRSTLVQIHVALGVTLLPFAIVRALWRVRSGKPQAPQQHKALMFAAALAWRILLIGVLVQLISGPLAIFFYGYPLQFLGAEIMASLFAKSDLGHEIAESVHNITGWTILATVVLHAGGALYHALIKRDGTLARMIMPGRTLRVTAAGNPLRRDQDSLLMAD